MKKTILLLTLSGLILGVSVVKLIEQSPGEGSVIVAPLDVTGRSIQIKLLPCFKKTDRF